MRLVLTLLVRNEADLLRATLEYHYSQGVDYVIATDNLSRDATPDILREYEQQGRLALIFARQDNYNQDAWVTHMARLAATKHGADWIINSDADEFWWPARGSLKTTLSAVSKEVGVVRCQRHNFVTRPSVASAPFWMEMVYRQTVSVNELGQPLPPKVCHRACEQVQVFPGNHHAQLARSSTVGEAGIDILHFPIRSYTNLEQRACFGGAAVRRNSDKRQPYVPRWQVQHELWKSGDLPRYFNELLATDEKIKDGLQNRSLCEDTRLRDYIILLTAGDQTLWS